MWVSFGTRIHSVLCVLHPASWFATFFLIGICSGWKTDDVLGEENDMSIEPKGTGSARNGFYTTLRRSNLTFFCGVLLGFLCSFGKCCRTCSGNLWNSSPQDAEMATGLDVWGWGDWLGRFLEEKLQNQMPIGWWCQWDAGLVLPCVFPEVWDIGSRALVWSSMALIFSIWKCYGLVTWTWGSSNYYSLWRSLFGDTKKDFLIALRSLHHLCFIGGCVGSMRNWVMTHCLKNTDL